MQCVILAGGLGTRMYPVTQQIPKNLIPIGDRPFADYQLRWLAKHGVTEVVYSIGYLGEMIEEFVGDGSRYGLRAEYVSEGEELRGTGGALRLAYDRGVLRDKFLMIYGDSFLPIDVAAVWRGFLESGKPALMTIFRNDGKWDTSNVAIRAGANGAEKQSILYDKTKATPAEYTHIDYGLSAFARELIASEIPAETKVDLAVVFKRVSERGDLAGYEVSERFYEIGSPEGLADLQSWVSERWSAFERMERTTGWGATG